MKTAALDIVKKNIVSIICGVVIILAVVFTYFPLGGFFEELGTKMQASQGTWSGIKNIIGRSHNEPVTDPLKPNPEPLSVFPTEPVIAKGEEAIKRVKEQSEGLVKLAVGWNRHEPLVRSALPSGVGAPMGRFRNEYHQKLEQFKIAMNATAPPTDEEIRAAENEALEKIFKPQIIVQAGQEVNRQKVDQDFNEFKLGLPQRMVVERAKKATMYLADKALDQNPPPPIPLADAAQFPSPIDVWTAQMSLWIQEDVVAAIVESNKSAGGRPTPVENAVVKRLVEINIPKEYITATGRVQFSAANQAAVVSPTRGGAEAPPPPPAGQQSPANYSLTPTGRICNPVYDVVHFTIRVDVDAEHFRTFIANLMNKRFITILDCHVQQRDREITQAEGCLLGNRPVIMLKIRAEAVFFREWTKPLMPEGIRRILNVPKDEPVTPVAGR